MALIRTAWTEVRFRETDIEVDGFDPDYDHTGQIREAIMEQTKLLDGEQPDEESVSIQSYEIIRLEDEPHHPGEPGWIEPFANTLTDTERLVRTGD